MSKRQGMRGLGLAAMSAAAAAIVVWWWRSAPIARATLTPRLDAHEEIDDLPPDSSIFEPAPLSERQLSARPSDRPRRSQSADDLHAIRVDDLGSAFLARATDSPTEDDEDGDTLTEYSGFRIINPRGAN